MGLVASQAGPAVLRGLDRIGAVLLAAPFIGHDGKKYLPFVFTLFAFVLFMNLQGMFLVFTATSQLAVTLTLGMLVILTVVAVGFAVALAVVVALADAAAGVACLNAGVDAGTIDPMFVPPHFRFVECGVAEAYWSDIYSMSDAEFVALVEAASPCFLDIVASGRAEAWEVGLGAELDAQVPHPCEAMVATHFGIEDRGRPAFCRCVEFLPAAASACPRGSAP